MVDGAAEAPGAGLTSWPGSADGVGAALGLDPGLPVEPSQATTSATNAAMTRIRDMRFIGLDQTLPQCRLEGGVLSGALLGVDRQGAERGEHERHGHQPEDDGDALCLTE